MSLPITLDQVFPLLEPYPHIKSALTIQTLSLFLQLGTHLQSYLAWSTQTAQIINLPVGLTEDYRRFLSAALSVSLPVLDDLWMVLRQIIPVKPGQHLAPSQEIVAILLKHAVPRNIG